MVKKLFLGLVSFALVSTAVPAIAQDNLTKAYKDKAAVEAIIKEYIAENPKMIVDALQAYEVQRAAEEERAAQQALVKNADKLFNNPKSPVAGAKDGNVTVVEFFDYNCGYCKRALTDIMGVLEEDKNLKVVFKEVPILSDSSREVAKWALAAKNQGKYFDYHVKLMEHRGQYDAATLERFAKEVGLDVAKLKVDKESSQVAQTLDDNLNLMREVGIRGTPSFVIGDTLARGYVGLDRMKQLIAEERAN